MLKFKKIWLLLLIIPIGLVVFLQISNQENLQVHFFDVGQGDAILIETPGHNRILIDGGPDDSILQRLGEQLPWTSREIDLVVLTHPHDDHLFGLVQVLQRYQVKQIIMTDAVHNSPRYLEWLKLIQDQKIPVRIIGQRQIVMVDDLALDFLYPNQNFVDQDINNLNNTSIVLKLKYGQTSFLLMGDAEEEVEEALLLAKLDLSANILKVGHHGSDNATTEAFLQAVSPQEAIISVGADNSFNHPSQRIVRRLERQEVLILRTDQQGTITIESDGQSLSSF